MDESRFEVPLSCLNCGNQWDGEFPLGTLVTEARQYHSATSKHQLGVEACHDDREDVDGFVRCPVCQTEHVTKDLDRKREQSVGGDGE